LATITLNRKVLIKVIVSQEFKDSFIKQLEILISEINTNIEKLKSEESKLLLNVGSSFSTQELANIRARLSKERESQEATKKRDRK